jgi:hypothetical protein
MIGLSLDDAGLDHLGGVFVVQVGNGLYSRR